MAGARGIDNKDAAKQQQQYIEKLKQKINASSFKGTDEQASRPTATRQLSKLYSSSNLSKMGAATGSEEEEEPEEEDCYPSSEEDLEAKQSYKTAGYWALPENVRHAIDVAREKSRHSDFYNRLKSLNDKIHVYKRIFYTKTPKYEEMFYERKRKRLEALMRREQ